MRTFSRYLSLCMLLVSCAQSGILAESDTKEKNNATTGAHLDAEPTCTPVVHATQGTHGDLREFQRYRLVGASPNSRRLAVLYSHFGPSSWVSFVNLYVYESDNATPLLYRGVTGDPMGEPGSDEELVELEEWLMTEAAGELIDLDIQVGSHLPLAVAWCANDDTVHTELPESRTWSFTTQALSCPESYADPSDLWRLCREDGLVCIEQPADAHNCGEGALSLVDIYAGDDVVWAIAVRDIPLFGGALRFKELSAAGANVR